MTFRRSLATSTSIIAGTLVELGLAAPAYAAPWFALPFDVTTFSVRDILLYGSIALLVVALAMKVVRDRHHVEPTPQGPDLRWWKNPPSPQS